ncbi:hypothetical protein [Reyranella sp.]|uniref:hypothetical protein n=1 Tax=Reyranella sp. TaxID=1929291 RepID=UPI0027303A4C|nr:hypothetical protein [Reyranella sp.]MDP2377793.1 hypothetical protein [Reyranella sp.]
MYAVEPIGSLPISASPPYLAPTPSVPSKKALFLSSREFDGATIVGSTEVSTLPASFLQDIQPQKKWRLTSKLGQFLAVTLAGPLACDALAFIAANFTGAAVCRVIAATAAASLPASPDFATPWQSVWPVTGKPNDRDAPSFTCVVRFTNTSAYQHWRIEIADIGAETTYIEIGRVLIGVAFRLRIDLNPSLGLTSPDIQARTPFGRTYSDHRGDASRRILVPMQAVNDVALKRSLFALQRYCGKARDFVFSLETGAPVDPHLYAMQAQFTDDAQFEAQPFWDANGQVWRTTLSLTEPL